MFALSSRVVYTFLRDRTWWRKETSNIFVRGEIVRPHQSERTVEAYACLSIGYPESAVGHLNQKVIHGVIDPLKDRSAVHAALPQ